MATGINFVGGMLYIWSVISKGLINELRWTSKQASLPYTIAIISFVVFMTVFGKIQDKYGPKLTAMFSGIFIGLGLILSGFTTNPAVMVLTFGLITGAGIGISNISTTPPAVKWFPPDKKGMVTGIVVAGVGIASVFYSPLANYLIKTIGISKTFIYIGIGALVLILTGARFLTNPPGGYEAGGINGQNRLGQDSSGFGRDLNWRGMLGRPDFYMLWLMLAFSSSAGLMIIGHAANITKIQVHWEGGYILVILLAIFNAGGRLLGGIISDRIGRIPLMRVIFILQALNMLFFSRYTTIVLLAGGVALAGFCYGATFSIFPATVLDLYGVKNFGSNYGLIMTAWGCGGVIGPMVAAVSVDSAKTYNIAYLIACILLLAAFSITFLMKHKNVSNNVIL